MLLPVVISIVLACSPAPARAELQRPSGDDKPARSNNPTIDELARWTSRFTPQSAVISAQDMHALEELVADARMIQVSAPALRQEVFLALLDLALLIPPGTLPREYVSLFGPDERERASQLGYDAMRRAIETDRSGELCQWIAGGILAQPKSFTLARRRGVLAVLRGRHERETLLAIMACAVGPERELRDDAMAALVGWQDDGVHRFMLQQLEKTREQPAWITTTPVFTHFSKVKIGSEGEIPGLLRESVALGLASNEWRSAVRALRLSQALDNQLAIPLLLMAWPQWIARRERDMGSKRVEGDILHALQKRTGREIGAFPERWNSWWRSVQSGTSSGAAGEKDPAETRAAFFGLRPITDRVVFVIDRSGSMSSPMHVNEPGTTSAGPSSASTRYQEALLQMQSFLRALGPQTKFRIVLFDSEVHVWKDKLQPATKSNLEAAQRWCAAQHPDGGTMLRAGIEEVLRLRPDGTADVGRIEEDTVIVLCDGETTEGPYWVESVLERVNSDACLVFDCVQIGTSGDGTLKRLSAASGGESIQVD